MRAVPPALWGLTLIIIVGVLLRAYLEVRYRPALLGYPDTVDYVINARSGLFTEPFRVSGYSLFLRALHAVSPHLLLVTLAQHVLGLASGLILFDLLRRTVCRPGLALIPAAVVVLGGPQILLEHAVLGDTLFLFLVDSVLWLAVRMWTGSRWWALGVGLAIGAATIVRTVGLELLPVVFIFLLLPPIPRTKTIPSPSGAGGIPSSRQTAHRSLRTRSATVKARLAPLMIGAVGAMVVMFPYVYAHERETGSWGFQSTSYFQLYGRVAPWADCAKFTPPPGTSKLCIRMPVSQRPGSQFWLFTRNSPAVAAYGTPDAVPRRIQGTANSQLRSFALAAIEGQPLTYLQYAARDLARAVDPTFSSSPYRKIGNLDYGVTPDGMRSAFFDTANLPYVERVISTYYRTTGLAAGKVTLITRWERATRIEGPVMVLLLVLALAAPFIARGLRRRVALLSGSTAAVLLIGPVAVLGYDWRYVIPAFGPLAVAATIGGLELVTHGLRSLRRRVATPHRMA